MRLSAFAGLLLGVFLLLSPALAQSLLSPAQFRDAAIAMVQARAPDASIEVADALSFRTRRGDSIDMITNLDRAYAEYQNAPEALEVILDRWARVVTNPPNEAQRSERIVAVVRPRGMVEAYEQYAATTSPEVNPLITRPLAGDLVQVLVFDSEEAVQYASEEALSEIGVSVDQAWTLAPQNLPARLGEIEAGGIPGYDSLAFMTGGNGLTPSVLAGDRHCQRQTTLVFLVVDRNGMVVADRTDAQSRRQLRALLAELRETGGQGEASLTPVMCRDGALVEYDLAGSN